MFMGVVFMGEGCMINFGVLNGLFKCNVIVCVIE